MGAARGRTGSAAGHTLRGYVDWNKLVQIKACTGKSHTLRGCVDWNIVMRLGLKCDYWSHPSWVCGLKPQRIAACRLAQRSHPSWVCGLKHNFNKLIICQFRSWWFFIHYQQRNWQNRAIFLYLTPKLSGISGKIFKFAFKYNIL